MKATIGCCCIIRFTRSNSKQTKKVSVQAMDMSTGLPETKDQPL